MTRRSFVNAKHYAGLRERGYVELEELLELVPFAERPLGTIPATFEVTCATACRDNGVPLEWASPGGGHYGQLDCTGGYPLVPQWVAPFYFAFEHGSWSQKVALRAAAKVQGLSDAGEAIWLMSGMRVFRDWLSSMVVALTPPAGQSAKSISLEEISESFARVQWCDVITLVTPASPDAPTEMLVFNGKKR